MKYFFYLPLAVLFLTNCGSEPEPQAIEVLPEVDTTAALPQETDPDLELMMADSTFLKNVSAFPKHWVEVGVEGKQLVYTDYCNMGHPHWKLIETDSCWQIETFYGQDGELWQLINMTANVQSAEGQTFQEGIFVVNKITYPDNETYEVSYFWNQTVGFCSFGDFFDKTKKFADNAKYKSFKIVDDPDCFE